MHMISTCLVLYANNDVDWLMFDTADVTSAPLGNYALTPLTIKIVLEVHVARP